MRRTIKRRTAFILERHAIFADDHSAPSYHVTAIVAERLRDDEYLVNKKVLKRFGNELHSANARYVILAEENCTQ